MVVRGMKISYVGLCHGLLVGNNISQIYITNVMIDDAF